VKQFFFVVFIFRFFHFFLTLCRDELFKFYFRNMLIVKSVVVFLLQVTQNQIEIISTMHTVSK